MCSSLDVVKVGLLKFRMLGSCGRVTQFNVKGVQKFILKQTLTRPRPEKNYDGKEKNM
jgi:hypothetical protein